MKSGHVSVTGWPTALRRTASASDDDSVPLSLVSPHSAAAKTTAGLSVAASKATETTRIGFMVLSSLSTGARIAGVDALRQTRNRIPAGKRTLARKLRLPDLFA